MKIPDARLHFENEQGTLKVMAIYQLMVDIYKFPKLLHLGLLMALA